MAQATQGTLAAFCPDSEEFSAYLERVLLYFEVNETPDNKKVPIFLSVLGGRVYGLVRSLVAPANPKDKTFAELTAVLTAHFEPKPNVIAERFRFHRRSQHQGESVSEYVAELRRLASRCSFGEYLEEALRDRLVCGLRSESTQKKLLSEEDLTLDRAIHAAQNLESAQKHAQTLKGASDLTLGRVEKHDAIARSCTNGKSCYRCGKSEHLAPECPFRGVTCHKCGKKGHLARVCRRQTSTASCQICQEAD